MTGINALGNAPSARKPPDKSNEYWKKRADQEDQLNWGAPEEPDRPNYDNPTAKALSAAQQPLTLGEVLEKFDERNFTFRLTGKKTTEDDLTTHQGILIRNSDGKSAAIKVITNRQGIQKILLNEQPITNDKSQSNQNMLYTFLFNKTGEMLKSSLPDHLYNELTESDFNLENSRYPGDTRIHLTRRWLPEKQHISSVSFDTDEVLILVREPMENNTNGTAKNIHKTFNETFYRIRYSDLPFQTKDLINFLRSFTHHRLDLEAEFDNDQ